MTIIVTTDKASVIGYTIIKFTTDLTGGSGLSDSIDWVCPVGITNVEYLVVAGGGGGGGTQSNLQPGGGGEQVGCAVSSRIAGYRQGVIS